MSKIAKETDLTKLEGDPTARANPSLRRERCRFTLTMPSWLGGSTLQLDTRTFAGSPLTAAITTALLIATGCLVMGVAAAIGAPAWLVVGALFVPAALYVVIRRTFRSS